LLPFKPSMQVSPARRAAFEILRRVEVENAHASVLLAGLDETLRADDRALCHEIVLGVLRRRLWLDRGLEHFANRRAKGFDLPVSLALRIGLYQLRFLTRIPPSAAVNESVKLVQSTGVRSAAGLVNAVLRRATREPDYDPAAETTDPLERLAIETSHPRWLIERWVAAFGPEETQALARANNEAAPVAFRLTAKAREGEQQARIIEDLKASGAHIAKSRIAPDAWRVVAAEDGQRVNTGALLRTLSMNGLIYLQDEASQMVAHQLAAGKDDRVLDVCAAPGSKTTHIAALAAPEMIPAMIVAGDLYEHRLRTLRELANAQGVDELQLLAHDATSELVFADGAFDRVLVDAPCSGTGTLRRNPEIKWRLTPSDIPELRSKQERILANAATVVRRGGLLLYSTCALEMDENETVVAGFLREHADFRQAQLAAGPDLLTAGGAIRTWPHRHDVDGFFIMALRRARA
jgi:16S rRNA (cytosine967-C5)-methyltransferase